MKNLEFESRNKKMIETMSKDKSLKKVSKKWFLDSYKHEYSYHFKWLGRPIIQYPQDVIAVQEIIWQVKPDLIIETGVAHGGSLILSASILELIGNGDVIGIDVEIRTLNRKALEKHPLYKRIHLIEGSSTDPRIFDKVRRLSRKKKRIMVILDSNHSHEHVLTEMKLYSPLITKGSYLIVFDTVIDDMPQKFFTKRQWGKDNNPKTAIKEFLKSNNRFKIDSEIQEKLLITAAPDGYMKCIK